MPSEKNRGRPLRGAINEVRLLIRDELNDKIAEAIISASSLDPTSKTRLRKERKVKGKRRGGKRSPQSIIMEDLLVYEGLSKNDAVVQSGSSFTIAGRLIRRLKNEEGLRITDGRSKHEDPQVKEVREAVQADREHAEDIIRNAKHLKKESKAKIATKI